MEDKNTLNVDLDNEEITDDIKKEMKKSEINLKIFLNRGRAELVTWTSDLSHDYVKINAEYRT